MDARGDVCDALSGFVVISVRDRSSARYIFVTGGTHADQSLTFVNLNQRVVSTVAQPPRIVRTGVCEYMSHVKAVTVWFTMKWLMSMLEAC